jgi:Glycosyltransferase family 92
MAYSQSQRRRQQQPGGKGNNTSDDTTTNRSSSFNIQTNETPKVSFSNGKDRHPRLSLLPLTVYLEPPEPTWNLPTAAADDPVERVPLPLPRRTTTAHRLKKVEFPHISCPTIIQELPELVVGIEENSGKRLFPSDVDPYLPWIHDVFPSPDGTKIQFVAQNKRRCDTGETRTEAMKHMEPQVALFQPIPIIRTSMTTNGESAWHDDDHFRLSPTMEEATHPETRFICRFHFTADDEPQTTLVQITLSEYPFNYEYVAWRKSSKKKSMIETKGRDVGSFWLSTLLFSCPVPEAFKSLLLVETQQQSKRSRQANNNHNKSDSWLPVFYVDVIPIRTPVRKSHMWLTERHVGPSALKSLLFNGTAHFGSHHILPPLNDSGRWENIPICRRRDLLSPRPQQQQQRQHKTGIDRQEDTIEDERSDSKMTTPLTTTGTTNEKPHRLVLCTWTSSSYTRRGDATRVSDSTERLLEWIEFHLLVGFEHIYIYDNTQDMTTDNTTTSATTEMGNIVARYFGTKRDDEKGGDNQQQQIETPQVTLHRWPCEVCNNNRPNHPNPGERSSQYAAEASCRERYGPLTDWMAFIDTDEYLVPMKKKAERVPEDGVANKSNNGHSHKGFPLWFASTFDYTWQPLLEEMDQRQISVLKMVSSRGKPRVDLMEYVSFSFL